MKYKFNISYEKEKHKITKKDIPIFDDFEKDIQYTFSGKTAISFLLRYYLYISKLQNKSDELLVPKWLGFWVYNTIQKYCFPTTTFNKSVKGILLYHQWGFPQKIDEIISFCKENNLFIIEDCAHSFYSFYNKQRVGSFGDAAIFSLSKFFPCVVGGAVYSQNQEINLFCKRLLSNKTYNNLGKDIFRYRANIPTKQSLDYPAIMMDQYYAVYSYLTKMPRIAKSIVTYQLLNNAINNRIRNYKVLKAEFQNLGEYQDMLSEVNCAPWIFPLFLNQKHLEKVSQALKLNGFESGIYNFDINRNILSPEFVSCVPIPCHQDISENDIAQMIEVIRKNCV